MPPQLEITREMLGPPRTGDLTRAYLLSLMIWPDNPGERRRIMRTASALHMREMFRTNPAARDAMAPELIDLGIAITSPEDIRERAGDRQQHGLMTGHFLLATVMVVRNPEFQQMMPGPALSLEELKTYVATKGKPGTSRSTFVNTIIPRYRSVAHLWAASIFVNNVVCGRPVVELPCPPGQEALFLFWVDALRSMALATKHPRRRGHRQERLLDPEEAWAVPDDLPLIVNGDDLRRRLRSL